MKAVVDMSKCAGHAMCYAVDSELYQIDDLGYASRREFLVPSDEEQAAHEGARACPERAITLE